LAVNPDIARLQTAADHGSVAQEIELAADYFVGRGVPQDEKLAAHWYEKAADAGDPAAQNQIGYFYQLGIGVKADVQKAVHWYQLADANGLVGAKVNLGVAYLWGLGVPKDTEFAAQLFRQAAAKGSGSGASYLGEMYYSGTGVKQDKPAAIKWYETGVKLHSPFACYDLGLVYFTSDDRPHDFAKAATLLREAASTGFVPAMSTLAQLLVLHPQLAQSSNEARSWLDQAASAGAWKASVMLGLLARDGNGEPADTRNAYYHFKIALLQGGEPAQHLIHNDIKVATAKLNPEEIQALDSNADRWFQQHRLTLNFIFKYGDNRKLFPAYALTAYPDGLHAGLLIPTPPANSPAQNPQQKPAQVESFQSDEGPPISQVSLPPAGS